MKKIKRFNESENGINYSKFDEEFEHIISDLSDRKDIFRMDRGYLELEIVNSRIKDIKFEHEQYFESKMRFASNRNYYPSVNIMMYIGDISNEKDRIEIDGGDYELKYYTNTDILDEYLLIFEEAISCMDRLKEIGFKVVFGTTVGFVLDIHIYDESNEVK